MLISLTWKHNDATVTFRGSRQSNPNASVSGRRFNETIARLDNSSSLRFFHHTFTDTIFDAAATVEKFTFDQNLAFQVFGNGIQANQGCFSNSIHDRVTDTIVTAFQRGCCRAGSRSFGFWHFPENKLKDVSSSNNKKGQAFCFRQMMMAISKATKKTKHCELNISATT